MTMAVDIGLKSRDSRDDTWSLFAALWQWQFSKL